MKSKSLIFILLFGYLGSLKNALAQYQQQYKHGLSSPTSPSSISPPLPFKSMSISSAYTTNSRYQHQYPTPIAHYPLAMHSQNSHHPNTRFSSTSDDYETSGGGPSASVVPYQQSSPESSASASQMNSVINHHQNTHSYLNSGSHYPYNRVSKGYDQLVPQSHRDQMDKESSNIDYEQSDSTSYNDEHDSKESTVGDLYHKKPTIESEYDQMDQMASGDYGYQQQQQIGQITSTEYRTGHLMKPKKSYYPKPMYSSGPVYPAYAKPVTFTVPQTKTGYPQEKPGLPSLEIPFLDKLIPNDMMKNSNLKFPAIDFNYILGNILGQNENKGSPAISVAAPEGAANLLTHLAGVGKPIAVNAPTIDILGSNSGNTRTKIQGFSVPDFLKTSSSLIHGFNVPVIDLSGSHSSGMRLPHFDMPKTESIGKSPKISAVLPIGPSIHSLRHLPFPSIPKLKLPDFAHLNLKNFKIPSFDLTKIQKKDGMTTAEDNLKPSYVAAPPIVIPKNGIGVPEPAFAVPPALPAPIAAKAITIAKPKKIITAYPLVKGPLSGHVVIEDYPFGRQQYGPHDDGGEPEIGCAELDKIIHATSDSIGTKPIISNSVYPVVGGSKKPLT